MSARNRIVLGRDADVRESARNRIVLGRDADVREGAANRTPAASPWRGGQRRDWSREIHDVVETVRYHLGNACARVAYAHLHSRIYKKLKKVKILLSTVNIGRKRHCAGGAARKA